MSGSPTIDKHTFTGLAALVLLAVVGLTVATIGYDLGNGNWGVFRFIVVALGIGFFAGGLSQLIARISEVWFGDKCSEQLRKLVAASFTSKESDLSDIRKPLYLYYKSTYRNHPLWRRVELDFSNSRHPGSVEAHVTLKHPGGKKDVHYTFEAGIRTHTLVILSERKGEASAELVFPTFKKEFSDDCNCGLTFHQNWDQEQTIDPAVIFPFSKYAADASGLLSEADSVEIEKEWFDNFFVKQGRWIPRDDKQEVTDGART